MLSLTLLGRGGKCGSQTLSTFPKPLLYPWAVAEPLPDPTQDSRYRPTQPSRQRRKAGLILSTSQRRKRTLRAAVKELCPDLRARKRRGSSKCTGLLTVKRIISSEGKTWGRRHSCWTGSLIRSGTSPDSGPHSPQGHPPAPYSMAQGRVLEGPVAPRKEMDGAARGLGACEQGYEQRELWSSRPGHRRAEMGRPPSAPGTAGRCEGPCASLRAAAPVLVAAPRQRLRTFCTALWEAW